MARNPFDTQSPYEALGEARRQRLMMSISRATILVVIPIVVFYGLMLLNQFAWQTLLTLILVICFIPLSLVSNWLARQGKASQAGYLLLPSIAIILGINMSLVESLEIVVGPAMVVLIVMAGMLLGPRQSYILAGISATLWIVSQGLVASGAIVRAPLPEPLGTLSMWMIMGLVCIFAAILSLYATRDLRLALDDATYDLVQANRQLEQASQLKTQFTARTSHELRTPLSAIIVFTDLALRRAYGPLTEKQEDSLRRVLLSAKRLHALIEDILDISKIEAGELELNEDRFRVSKLVDTLNATLESPALEKKLEFSVSLSPAMPAEILGDEKRLTQILINLTHNAIKFTEKGAVRVTIAPVNSSEWHMQVQDTGRGIHEKNFETIFEAFRQEAVAANEAGTKGTGLGLAITHQLVQMMHGKIHLTSQLGKGSTFDVVLPLRQPESEVSTPGQEGGH